MKIKDIIFVNRPAANVFSYITDYSTHPKWADAVRVDILKDGAFSVGTRMY